MFFRRQFYTACDLINGQDGKGFLQLNGQFFDTQEKESQQYGNGDSVVIGIFFFLKGDR